MELVEVLESTSRRDVRAANSMRVARALSLGSNEQLNFDRA